MTGLIRQVHDTLATVGDEALALHVRLGRGSDGIEATRTWTSHVTDGGHNALIGQAHAALAAAADEAVQARAHVAAAAGFISEYLAVLSAGSETPGSTPGGGVAPHASGGTSGSSPLERAANALAAIGAAIRRDQAAVAIARNDIDRLGQQFRAPATGGLNPLIGQVTVSLAAATAAVDRTIAHLAAADEHVADYLAVVLGRSVIRPSGAELPGPRTAFAARTDLSPDAEYVVSDRGRFRTSRDGLVIRVRTVSGLKGAWNPELNSPAPNARYGVDDRYEFETDAYGRTTRMATDQLGFDPRSETEDRRNLYQQSQVGRTGGRGYEGGHLAGTKHLGPGERINLVPMLEQVNRGAGPESFARLEETWRDLLETNPGARIAVDIRVDYRDDSRIPYRVVVDHSIDGVAQRRKVYRNVR